jgi:hypothetical protein
MAIFFRHRQRIPHGLLLTKDEAGDAQIGQAAAHRHTQAEIGNARPFRHAIEQPSDTIGGNGHIPARQQGDVDSGIAQCRLGINARLQRHGWKVQQSSRPHLGRDGHWHSPCRQLFIICRQMATPYPSLADSLRDNQIIKETPDA